MTTIVNHTQEGVYFVAWSVFIPKINKIMRLSRFHAWWALERSILYILQLISSQGPLYTPHRMNEVPVPLEFLQGLDHCLRPWTANQNIIVPFDTWHDLACRKTNPGLFWYYFLFMISHSAVLLPDAAENSPTVGTSISFHTFMSNMSNCVYLETRMADNG